MRLRGSQSFTQPQTSNTNFDSIRLPSVVWTTSGWNCTLYSLRAGAAIAATAQVDVAPDVRKSRWQFGHQIAMAHPDLLTLGKPAE